MKRILNYLNPLQYLGVKDYGIRFPLVATVTFCLLSEYYSLLILKRPDAVGSYLIFINIAMIIYFSFRKGLKGGLVTTFVTLIYYLYVIYSRNYTGVQLRSGIITTFILGLIYTSITLIIGYLKQKIDGLIENINSERKWLRTIIDQMPVGVVITDDRGKIMERNKQLKLLTGRNIDKDFTVGKDTLPYATFPNKKPVPPSKWPLAQAFKSGKPVIRKEFVIKNAKGEDKFLQISASLINNKAGKVVAGVSTISDLTDYKEQEKRKDDFVNMASHELKTPLTSIKLYFELLKKRMSYRKDKKLKNVMKSIELQIEKLQDLVLNMLDVSRIQTGKLIFNVETLDLNQLLASTVNEMQKTTKIHQIIFRHSAKTLKLSADKMRIAQVASNIINNAIKYSPKGGRIIVQAKGEKGKVVVSVQDQGIGISREHVKRVFERLYQVPGTVEKTFPGLGMGLYISREIIRHHRGNMWVTSEPGKGSTFYFSLPLK